MPLTTSNLIQPIKPADTSEHSFIATVNDGATEHHFSITGDLKKQHVLALAAKRADETASSDINAKIEHASVNVPFKGVDKTRATILKVLLPCVRLNGDVDKNASLTGHAQTQAKNAPCPTWTWAQRMHLQDGRSAWMHLHLLQQHSGASSM